MEKTITPSKEALAVAYQYWCDNDFRNILPDTPEKKDEYNNVPVSWCVSCGSLAVVDCTTPLNEEVTCYCSKCNSTTIQEGNIYDWLKLNNKQNS